MSSGRPSRTTSLTLVTAPETADAQRPRGDRDWSKLMALAQDGDRRAYRTLLEDVEPYIRSLAVRCFKQASDVEDAVQDVMLTIHMVRHAYDPSRPFGPWLLALANRRIIDRLRREIRQKAREITLSAEHETFAEPAKALDDRIPDEAVLSEAIERLSPDQRQAIKMLKLNEMSLKEAAVASGRSIGALKVATHTAIKRLRQMLRQRDDRP